MYFTSRSSFGEQPQQLRPGVRAAVERVMPRPAVPTPTPPGPGTPPPAPSLPQVIARCLRVLQATPLDAEPTRRLRCVLGMVGNPSTDDRYVNGYDYVVRTVTVRIAPDVFPRILSSVRRDLTSEGFASTQPDASIRESLRLLDARIFIGIASMNREMHVMGAAMSAGKLQIKDWIAGRQRNANSVYSCYGGVRDRR